MKRLMISALLASATAMAQTLGGGVGTQGSATSPASNATSVTSPASTAAPISSPTAVGTGSGTFTSPGGFGSNPGVGPTGDNTNTGTSLTGPATLGNGSNVFPNSGQSRGTTNDINGGTSTSTTVNATGTTSSQLPTTATPGSTIDPTLRDGNPANGEMQAEEATSSGTPTTR